MKGPFGRVVRVGGGLVETPKVYGGSGKAYLGRRGWWWFDVGQVFWYNIFRQGGSFISEPDDRGGRVVQDSLVECGRFPLE